MATRGRRDDTVAKLYRRIYAVVRRIPRGRVATYGQVAALAGLPRGGRVAGAAMKTSPAELGLPWHRVIGKRARNTGRIAIHDPVGAGTQRAMLEKEGVEISRTGGIALDRFNWKLARAADPSR